VTNLLGLREKATSVPTILISDRRKLLDTLAALPPHAKVRVVPLNKSHTAILATTDAMELVCAGSFEGKVKGGRLRSIREVDSRISNTFDPNHWAGRGCIRVFGDGRTQPPKFDYRKALMRSPAYPLRARIDRNGTVPDTRSGFDEQ
jgi:hypothetical protein